MISRAAIFSPAPFSPVAAPFFSSSKPRPFRKQAELRRHVQRTGAALLNQQCWLWGCDIRRAEGNLLTAFGFTRLRPPGEENKSTQYTLHLPTGQTVRLWGSGICFGDTTEGLFLNRFAFEPRHAAFSPGWQDPAMLKRSPRHWHNDRLAELCAWVAGYERWTATHTSVGYRAACLAAFADGVCSSAAIVPEWTELARCLRR